MYSDSSTHGNAAPAEDTFVADSLAMGQLINCVTASIANPGKAEEDSLRFLASRFRLKDITPEMQIDARHATGPIASHEFTWHEGSHVFCPLSGYTVNIHTAPNPDAPVVYKHCKALRPVSVMRGGRRVQILVVRKYPANPDWLEVRLPGDARVFYTPWYMESMGIAVLAPCGPNGLIKMGDQTTLFDNTREVVTCFDVPEQPALMSRTNSLHQSSWVGEPGWRFHVQKPQEVQQALKTIGERMDMLSQALGCPSDYDDNALQYILHCLQQGRYVPDTVFDKWFSLNRIQEGLDLAAEIVKRHDLRYFWQQWQETTTTTTTTNHDGAAPGEEPGDDWAVLMGRLQSLLNVSPVMLILRGVPGSGKSTLVHTIVERFPESLVCSADHYFEKENGKYVFDRNLLKDAHADCQERAEEAMRMDIPLVVIDNTGVKYWEYKKYEKMAAEFEYQALPYQYPVWRFSVCGGQVQIASLECDSIAVGVLARLLAGRNSHQVPEATILNMLRNWYNDESSFKLAIRGLPQ